MKKWFFIEKWTYPPSVSAAVGLLLGLLGLFLPLKTAQADCGIGGRAGSDYSFIHLDVMAWQSDYAPYLMGYQIIENYYGLATRDPERADNIAEWRDRFCDIADSTDIDYVIYTASVDEIAEVRDASGQRKKDIYYSLETNAFAQALRENGCKEALDYLIFAKQCEPFCVKTSGWEDRRRDVAQMFMLVSRGKRGFMATKSPFLRLRYLYQMMRLAHYAKDYTAVLRIFDDLMPKVERKQASIIYYWVLAHKAGALKALGQRAEAAYWFSQVFRYAPSKRRQAFESFDIKTDKEWQDCLNFCETEKDKAALYAMRASYDKARTLYDMAEIYTLDPKNEHLDMLLTREALRMEKILLGADFRRKRYDDNTVFKTKQYLAQLINFTKKCADEGYVRNPALWRATEGYLTLLDGNWMAAKQILLQARRNADDPILQSQIEHFILVAAIVGLELHPETAVMDSLLTNIRSSTPYAEQPSFETLLSERMGALYARQGQKGVAFLADFTLTDLEKNPPMEVIDALIALCQKTDKNIFERELVTLQSTLTIEDLLWDLKGRYYLGQFQLEAAAEAFKNVNEARRGRLFTPFADALKDCVNCTAIDTAGAVNRYEFVQQMLGLEYKAKAALDKAAPYYYRLGLGYYNMTYFGNSSGLADAYRSGRSWQFLSKGKAVMPVQQYPGGNREVLDCSVALAYFEKARALATDPETSARAAFWCAKCELNMFYCSPDNQYRVGSRLRPDVPPQYRRYFALLKQYHKNTQFVKQAMTECKYFDYYISKY